jgi:hypothetical protein
MSKMVELIRTSAVPPHIIQQAAKGTLVLPPEEAVEVLVALSSDPDVGVIARETLARYDAEQLRVVVSDVNTPREVLSFFLTPAHRRPEIMMSLINNTRVPDSTIAVVAETASRHLLEAILVNERALRSTDIMVGIAANRALEPPELQGLKDRLKTLGQELEATGEVFDYECALWMLEHAAEIALEAKKSFELVDATEEERKALAGDAEALAKLAPQERERISTVQKIAKMSVGGRVQLAMKGSKDERFVLIRDGSKIVALAVLESPKLGDNEVEMFASMKNVQEEILRAISRKRKFMKNYNVARQLVNNPRTPLDVALSLVCHLYALDLKTLSMNKNVSETVRKLALKMFKDKSGGKKSD